MREGYSRTAEGMALLRAIEQAQPPSLRIINDPYAAEFLQRPVFRFAARSSLLSRLMLSFMNRWAPGSQEFLTIRPRLVDELAARLATQGLQQIVMLGAGFDTMALRLRDRLQEIEIFEIDHPATQHAKQETYQRLGTPSNVRFVAVDFEKDDFVEKLKSSGFDASQRTLVTWLGVTYYLTASAMARALTQISSLGSFGMQLVFDYMLQEVIDGTSKNREALNKARRVAKLGEPWLFGLKPEELSAYLEPFGFVVIKDYGSEALHKRYCPQRPLPMNYVRIAVCQRI